MAKYEGTYACGHEGVIELIGPLKDREWRREREFMKLCPECWKKEMEEKREQENREAAEKAKEMELPELTGTPKQVGWANTLRQRLIDQFDQLDESDFRTMKRRYDLEVDEETVREILHFILEKRTSARYYIESRYENPHWLIHREYAEAMKSDEEREREREEKENLDQIRAEATVFPEERETNAIAEIRFDSESVSVSFERNEVFRQLVRGLGYRWDGSRWERSITFKTGSAEDRAAELGNRLLNAGFPIRIYDEAVRQMAIKGTFDPEYKRWVSKLVDEDRFALSWSDGTDLYKKARSLPGSRWDRPFVTVSVEHYPEVEEFAELYGFKFSTGALEMIEQFKKALEHAEVVRPAEVANKKPKDGLKELLESEVDVIDDLRD